jgi:hypothetical protein
MLLKKNIYSSFEGEKQDDNIKYEKLSSEKFEEVNFSFQKLLAK